MLKQSKVRTAALVFSVSWFCAGLSYAAPNVQVKEMTLNDVTVFLHGAELFNSAQVSLPAGESEVIFTNIASDINEKTLLLGTGGKALVKSTAIRRNYLTDDKARPEIDALASQIEELQDRRIQLQIEQQTIDAQLMLLQQNLQSTNDKTAATVSDLGEMWNFISIQMKEALTTKAALEKSLTEIDEKLNASRRQLSELQTKGVKPGNQLAVKFYAEQPVVADVRLSYAIRSASWVPAYDVSVDKIDAPVQFTYKADIAQASGIDWNNVNLKLSAGNLSQSAQAPTLKPNYLSIYERPDRVMYKSVPAEMVMESEMAKPEAAPVSGAIQNRSTMNDYVTTNVSGVNTTYAISLPYSIPSDSKQHQVSIKQQRVKGDYYYFVAPKLNDNAFLQVQIDEWQKLDLLPGKSSVYFEGGFIGEGYINTDDIRDGLMTISLGRDAKIIVKRANVSEMKSKPEFFGGNINQKYAYSIDVNNTRSEPVKLTVADQVPVSRNQQVTVNDVKYSKGGEWNKETGEIRWTLTIPASGAEKLTLSYTVKYPKDKEVSGL